MAPEPSDSAEFLYWTTYLYEADLVAEQLDQAGIPFHRCLETMGARFQMATAAPAGLQPGSRFLVVVPAAQAAGAKAWIAALPVSQPGD